MSALPTAVFLVVAQNGTVFGIHVQRKRALESIRKARIRNVWGWERKTPPTVVIYVPGRIICKS